MPSLGLVRVLVGGGTGHRYGVGFIPPGGLAEELGALAADPGRDRIPVTVTAAGALHFATEARHDPLLSPRRQLVGPRGTARVADGLRVNLRRPRGSHPPSSEPDGRPNGYLHRGPDDGRSPLFEGVDARSGDQLLSTSIREVEEQGYGPARLVGYVEASAPLTGVLTAGRPLPAVTAAGEHIDTNGWAPPCPGTHLDEPAAAMTIDRLPIYVRGWAMFPSESVTRIEVTVNGRFAGLARLGLPRPDLARQCGCTDAPIAGWEFELDADPTLMPNDTVTLGGVAYGSAGRRLQLPSRTVRLAHTARGAHPERLPSSPRSSCASADGAIAGPAYRCSGGDGGSLNVLVVTHSLTYGGAQLYLVELLERLAGRDLRFTVITPTDGPLRDRLDQIGAAVHVFPQLGQWDRTVLETRVAELAAFAAPQSFDLVVANTILALSGVMVAERLGLPSILAVHESVDLRAHWSLDLTPHDPVVFDSLAGAVNAASAVVFEAAATRDMYIPYADPRRLHAMPYGIDLGAIDRFRASSSREQARAELAVPAGCQLILCLGTTEPRKAQAPLARAFARVAERHPDATLALVGRGDDPYTSGYAACVTEHLRRARLLDRVLIWPLTANPFTWHEAADVLVCSSDLESLPRVILEAMAFETPVVSTNVFGIPEVVDDGVTGFLYRCRDEEAIVERLSQVLETPSQQDAIRGAAAAHVRAHHDADAYAGEFFELMRETVQTVSDRRPVPL